MTKKLINIPNQRGAASEQLQLNIEMSKNKTTAYQRIKDAQKENEKWLLETIRDFNKKGCGYEPWGIGKKATYNAIDRLEDAGKIKWRKGSLLQPKTIARMGYWIVKRKKNKTLKNPIK